MEIDVKDLPGLRPVRDLTGPVFQEPTSEDMEVSEPSFGEVFSAQRDQVHIANVVTRAHMLTHEWDEEFHNSLTYDKVKEDLGGDIDDIPPEWLEKVGRAGNPDDYQRIISQLQERREADRLMAEAGGAKGLAAMLAAYATDPVGFAADAASGGTTKGAVLVRFLQGGSRAALADVFLETIRAAEDPGMDGTDVAIGATTAFTLGGGFGAWLGEADEAMKVMRKGIEEDRAARSAGAAQVEGSTQAETLDTVPVHRDSVLDEIDDRIDAEGVDEVPFKPIRFDAAATGSNTTSKRVQKLNDTLLHNAVKKKGVINNLSAEERARSLEGKHEASLRRGYDGAYAEWLKENFGIGMIRRPFASRQREEFSRQVGDFLLSEGTLDVSPHVRKAANALSEFYGGHLDELKRAGVKGSEFVEHNPFYMPRKISRRRINDVIRRANMDRQDVDEVLTNLLVQGIKTGREAAGLDFDEGLSRLVAKAYIKRGLTQGNPAELTRHSDTHALALDDRDLVLDMLKGQVSDDEFREAVEILDGYALRQETTPEGTTPDRLKHRLKMDLNTSVEFNGETITLRDLFENDADMLAFSYGRWASGETALNERGLSTAKMEQALRELQEEAAENLDGKLEGAATPKDVERLEWAFKAVMGTPTEDVGSTVNRIARLGSSVGYITKMGSGVKNAIQETGTLLAMGTIRNNMKRFFPFWKQHLKDVINGRQDDGFFRQVEALAGGLGDTWARNTAGFRHTVDSAIPGEGRLARTEEFLDGLKRGATALNGMAWVTDMSRRMAAVNAIDILDDMAMGRKLPSWWANRSKSWTLSDERAKLIKDYFNSPAVKRGKHGGLVDLGDQMPDDVRVALEEFTYRYVSEGIQELQRGNLPRFMNTSVGRLALLFRSFTMGAWSRHTLKDLEHMDTLALQKLAYTTSLGFATYAGLQYLKYPTDSSEHRKRRKEKLQFDNVLRQSASYAVNASLMPDFLVNLSNATNLGVATQFERTSGLSRSINPFASNPAFAYADDALTVTKSAVTTLQGQPYTQEQFDALANLVALDTFWFMRPVNAAVKSNLPRERDVQRKTLLEQLSE